MIKMAPAPAKWVLLLLFPCLLLCCHPLGEEIPSSGGTLRVYGNEYTLTGANMWNLPSREVYSIDTFTYTVPKEIYGRQPFKVEKAIRMSGEPVRSGLTIVSLHTTGISYKGENNDLEGEGAILTIRFATEGEDLADGVYTFSATPKPRTFTAFMSTSFSSVLQSQSVAAVDGGEVRVSHTDSDMHIQCQFTRDLGTHVALEYKGPYRKFTKHAEALKEFKDALFEAQRKYETVQQIPSYAPDRVMTRKVRDSNAKSYLRLAAGEAVNITTMYNKPYDTDIRLCWDDALEVPFLTTPLARPDYNDNPKYYTMRSHTLYEVAPSSFGRKDYDQLTDKQMPTQYTKERVDLNTEGESYVFFRTAHGTRGCIRIHTYIAPKPYEMTIQFGRTLQKGHTPHAFKVDYKYIHTPAIPLLL